MDWMIIGLGNPGERYAATRHNIGWMVAEAFARKHTVKTASREMPFSAGKGAWHEARCAFRDADVLVILPTTYMNLSGKAAVEAGRVFKIPVGRMVAVVDEYNFPVGRIHLKNSGSDGGHNGTASMIEELRTPSFFRLRCGIDKKFGPGELVDYVLKPFADDEIAARDAMIEQSVLAIETLIELGAARAMQAVNVQKQSQA
ncbi:MAG: aminoacyl-tRNA hydrolase [Candidatus Kapabacteria bacterium]|jgi:PTH1 family peptidyl-tRNA hydrolase|nr:aminoacyl-tRNA hydrolase [Candidatus Kapabacteria bacterium]